MVRWRGQRVRAGRAPHCRTFSGSRTLWTTRQCKDLTWLPTAWLIASHSFHLLLTRQVPCFGQSCPTQNLAMETCYLVEMLAVDWAGLIAIFLPPQVTPAGTATHTAT